MPLLASTQTPGMRMQSCGCSVMKDTVKTELRRGGEHSLSLWKSRHPDTTHSASCFTRLTPFYFVLYRSVNQAPDYLGRQHLARARANAIISGGPDALISRADHREYIWGSWNFLSWTRMSCFDILPGHFGLGLVDLRSWYCNLEEKDVLGQCENWIDLVCPRPNNEQALDCLDASVNYIVHQLSIDRGPPS